MFQLGWLTRKTIKEQEVYGDEKLMTIQLTFALMVHAAY